MDGSLLKTCVHLLNIILYCVLSKEQQQNEYPLNTIRLQRL